MDVLQKNRNFISVLILIFCFSIAKSEFTPEASVPILNFEEFEHYLNPDNDTLYIINFWATWCLPCRKEIPFFEQIHLNYASKGVKVVLVSLDFVRAIESSLMPFLEKNNISADVVLLNDQNSNYWINQVDEKWSGALPATLFILQDKRIFLEKELSYNEITHHIESIN